MTVTISKRQPKIGWDILVEELVNRKKEAGLKHGTKEEDDGSLSSFSLVFMRDYIIDY
jgi:hypothetical protein